MLWSLIKILFFVALIGLMAFGGALLMDVEGGVLLSFGSFELNLTPLRAVIALIVVIALAFLLSKLLGLMGAFMRFLLGDETAVSRYFDRNRERRGFEALSEGLLALASGEGQTALSKASKAERYLSRPELTNVLKAQAALMAGEKRVAERAFRQLVKDEKTRFVGVHGIMRQKLAAGDTETALKLALKAFAIKPQHEETQDVLLRLQAQKGDWASARQTLAAKLKHGAIPKDVHKRRDAVLALSEAKDLIDEDKSDAQRLAAIEANKKSPDLIPAAVMAARGYVQTDKKRQAAKVLKAAWKAQPHPDLAAAFSEIEPEETPEARLKRFSELLKLKPSDPETLMLDAELHIAAEDFPGARRAMGDLADTLPDARALMIMAAIERGEGAGEAQIRDRLTQALNAPRGPQWVCDNCQVIAPEWEPVCSACEGFDTLSWRAPTQTETALQSDLLPPVESEDDLELLKLDAKS